MNRLQKKCFVASAGVHLLLALVLLIGPGFISSPKKQDDLPLLDFVPLKTVDELVSGGGNPKAKPPALQPVPPQPQPQPPVSAPPPKPEPQPEKIKEPDPPKQQDPHAEDDDFKPAKETKPRKIEVNKVLVTRKRDTSTDKRAREETQERAEAKAAADARRRIARQFGQAADRMGNSLSGATTVEDDFKGPGGGGVPYANWKQAIKTIYENAWLLPENVVDSDAVTAASITIARDGTVISSRIIHLSGDNVVDSSVQAALDRVRHTPPLPDTAKEERTITINFSVKSKRALG